MREMTGFPIKWMIIIPAAVNSLFVFANYWAISPWGSQAALWLVLFLILPLIVALLSFPLALLLGLVARLRRTAMALLVVSVIWLGSAVAGIRVGGNVRMQAFHQLAKKSEPLVAAIHAYVDRHGYPPTTLADLVPAFLPEVPQTGMGAYPEYEYVIGAKAERYDSNPWILLVLTPSGGINFDQFMYFPRQNYPEFGYGGALQRIGDWAYVHE